MTTVKLHDKEFVPYISAAEIDIVVSEIATKLNTKYQNCEQPPVFATVLTGAFVFGSDILRKITLDAQICFTSVSSYKGTVRSDKLECTLDIKCDVKGRDVIILDEIVDSGSTVAFLKQKYLDAGAKSVAIATLIYKPKTRIVEVDIDYFGFEMKEDKFIVGYGLDYNERGRLLKDIYSLKCSEER